MRAAGVDAPGLDAWLSPEMAKHAEEIDVLVCLAVSLTYSARTTADRILAIVPPISPVFE